MIHLICKYQLISIVRINSNKQSGKYKIGSIYGLTTGSLLHLNSNASKPENGIGKIIFESWEI